MKSQTQFVIAATLAAVLSAAACAAVQLRENVAAHGDVVRLSDLLPADASQEQRTAAEKISLGHAPEPGSIRTLTPAELQRAGVNNLRLVIPPQVTLRRAAWPLDGRSIRESLSQFPALAGLDLSEAQIVPPPEFATRAEHAALQVILIAAGADDRTLAATMRCRNRSLCGRFLVRVVFPRAVAGHWAAAIETGAGTSLSRPGGKPHGELLVEPNRSALLEIDSDGLRSTQAVFPLRPARMGEIIRVREPFSHRVSSARVAGDNLLVPEASSRGDVR